MEKTKVYFTKEITSESLVKIYEKLGIELKERYGIYVTGEYGMGNDDRNDYKAGITLKAVF